MSPTSNNTTSAPRKHRQSSAKTQKAPQEGTLSGHNTLTNQHSNLRSPPTRPPRPEHPLPAYFQDNHAYPDPDTAISPTEMLPASFFPLRTTSLEPRTTREKKNARVYPELQDPETASSQNVYQKAVVYAEIIAQKAKESEKRPKIGPSTASPAAPPRPPIVSALLNKRQRGRAASGGFTAESSELSATKTREQAKDARKKTSTHKPVELRTPSPKDEEWPDPGDNENYEPDTDYRDDNNFVKAFQGLRLFHGLPPRPGLRKPLPPLPFTSAPKKVNLNTESPAADGEVAKIPATPSAPSNSDEQSSTTSRSHIKIEHDDGNLGKSKGTSKTAENTTPTGPNLIPSPPPIVQALENNLRQATDNSESAPSTVENNPPSRKRKHSTFSPSSQSSTSTSQEAKFEEIDLRDSTPTPMRAPSTASESSDDDFEVVAVEGYQTSRNGRPGVWGRWVQGKK